MLGANYLAKAKPDGYTIASMGDAQQITAFILHKAPYKLSDLRVVCQWGYHNTTMSVPTDSPWKTMKEFIEYARKNPGLKYGHHRKGSSPWVQSRYLINEADIQIEGISFKSDPGVLTAILGKHVPIGVLGYVTARAQHKAGKIRMLMTFSPDGIDGEPNLPTLAQVLGKNVRIFPPSMAVFVPAKTPEPIVAIIHKAVKEITESQAFREKMRGLGIGVKYRNEEQYEARRKEHHEKVKKILLEGGLIKG
jgi:tripartite-type tricarboxylate transporter receptor subunit TctC